MIKSLLIAFFFSFLIHWNVSAQLHHQMLSSQGSTSKTNTRVIVTQTIGQQSINGNYTSKGFKIGQGFQQASSSRIIVEAAKPEFEVSMYPNPFSGIVNVKHNSIEDIDINIFDPAGKLVFQDLLRVAALSQTINLEHLSSGVYLVYLRSNQLNYFTKLIRE